MGSFCELLYTCNLYIVSLFVSGNYHIPVFGIATTVVLAVSILLFTLNAQWGVGILSELFTVMLKYPTSDVQPFNVELAIYTVVAVLTFFVGVFALVVDFMLSHGRLHGIQSRFCAGPEPIIAVSVIPDR